MTKKKKIKSAVNFSIKYILFLAVLILLTILFLPTAIFLAIALLPTVIAILTDKSSGKNKSFTIGSLNFAGCFPYLLGIWVNHDVADLSFDYLSRPQTIIVIYGAAVFGYFIYWFTTTIVSILLIQRSKARLKKISNEKEALENRWGNKVNGKVTLNSAGFPISELSEN